MIYTHVINRGGLGVRSPWMVNWPFNLLSLAGMTIYSLVLLTIAP